MYSIRMATKISIVIVSYNVRRFLDHCLESVERELQGINSYEVFVVDNASQDDTLTVLPEKYPWVKFIPNEENLGFARANNIAIRKATGEYILLLNPDTIVEKSTLREVIRFMDDHSEVGGAGVMMHNEDGTIAPESRRAVPTPWVSALKMLGFTRRYYMSHLPWNEPCQIEVISGAFCMLRHKALDAIGLLDEDFFMYGEDIDLSYRLLRGGWQNWYVPQSIIHFKGKSTRKSDYRYVHVFYQAMLIFFRKHYSHLSILYTLPVKAAIYFRAFIALIDLLRQKLHL